MFESFSSRTQIVSAFNITSMKKTTPMAGKLIPPTFNKRLVTNEGPEQTTFQEMELTPTNYDKSPPKKKIPPSKPSTLESADLFEGSTSGASREVSMLLAKFANVLSERAAADTSQMNELQGILAEAQYFESYLMEKKNHLKQALALISNNLKG